MRFGGVAAVFVTDVTFERRRRNHGHKVGQRFDRRRRQVGFDQRIDKIGRCDRGVGRFLDVFGQIGQRNGTPETDSVDNGIDPDLIDDRTHPHALLINQLGRRACRDIRRRTRNKRLDRRIQIEQTAEKDDKLIPCHRRRDGTRRIGGKPLIKYPCDFFRRQGGRFDHAADGADVVEIEQLAADIFVGIIFVFVLRFGRIDFGIVIGVFDLVAKDDQHGGQTELRIDFGQISAEGKDFVACDAGVFEGKPQLFAQRTDAELGQKRSDVEIVKRIEEIFDKPLDINIELLNGFETVENFAVPEQFVGIDLPFDVGQPRSGQQNRRRHDRNDQNNDDYRG